MARSDSENEDGETKHKKKSNHKKRSSRITTNDDEISQDNDEQVSNNEQDDYESDNKEKPKRKPVKKKFSIFILYHLFILDKSIKKIEFIESMISFLFNRKNFYYFFYRHRIDNLNKLVDINLKQLFQVVKMIQIMNHLVR